MISVILKDPSATTRQVIRVCHSHPVVGKLHGSTFDRSQKSHPLPFKTLNISAHALKSSSGSTGFVGCLVGKRVGAIVGFVDSLEGDRDGKAGACVSDVGCLVGALVG